VLANLTLRATHIFPAGTPDRIEPGTVTPTHVIPPSPHHQPVRLGHQVAAPAALNLDGIVVDDLEFGADTDRVDWLPEPAEGTWYIVSLPVGLAATHRTDLLVVHEPVRDLNGNTLGCRKLARPVHAALAGDQ